MTEELPVRYQKLVEGILVDGKTHKQSAIDAGFPPRSASNQASRVLRREDVRAKFQELRAAMGLDDEALLRKAGELLEAQQYALSRDGQVVKMGPDGLVQSRVLDQLFRAGGLYPDPRVELDQSTQNVLVIDSAKQPLAALDPFASISE